MKFKFFKALVLTLATPMAIYAQTVEVSNTTENSKIEQNLGRSRRIGQTFTTGSSTSQLSSIDVKLTNDKFNGGLLTLDLYEVKNNSFQLIASSKTQGYFVNKINTRNFQTKPSLKANTKYAFICRNNGWNFFNLAGANNNPYKGGNAFVVNTKANDPNQINYNEEANFDLYFKVNVTNVKESVVYNLVKSSGQKFNIGEKHYSKNGKYYVVFQTDGNLVVYNASNRFQWGTYNNLKTPLHGKSCVMQKNGNLNFSKDAFNKSDLWSLFHNTSQLVSGSTLNITDKGALVILTPKGKLHWSSK